MESDTIAAAIRKARLLSGLTQKQVADALDKSQTTVAAWESGRSQPDAKTIVQLSALFQVSSDFLLGLSNFRNNNGEAFLDALLGENTGTLPEVALNSFSAFMAELIQLCNLLYDVDMDLIPCAVDCATSIVRILKDLSKTFAQYERLYSVYYAVAKFLTHLNSSSDSVQKKLLKDDDFSEIVNECSDFARSIESNNPGGFAGEALSKIDAARDSMAEFALHLQKQLFVYDDFTKGVGTQSTENN